MRLPSSRRLFAFTVSCHVAILHNLQRTHYLQSNSSNEAVFQNRTRGCLSVPTYVSSERRGSPADQQHAASPSTIQKNTRLDKSARPASGFSNGAHGQRSPAVCAVCLGRNNHSFIECSATRIWDNSLPSASKRINRQLLIRSTDKPLCVDWQRGKACTTRSHDERHLCSGCLSTSHGAQHCTRAQTALPSVSV
jgi:hypothetical protein